MPKARPVSLHPLSFDEAIKALVRVDPEKVGVTSKHREGHAPKLKKIKGKVHKKS
jgi:hypothetical protein